MMLLPLGRKRPTVTSRPVIRCSRCDSRLTLEDAIVRDADQGFAHTACIDAGRPVAR